MVSDLERLGLDVRLTTRQAAAYLGCAQQTLRNWRCEGIGPKWHRASSTRILYWKRDLDEWDEERQRNAGKWLGASKNLRKLRPQPRMKNRRAPASPSTERNT
jgi:hypothetical protein